MSSPTIEQKIAFNAGRLVRVRITKRVRSKTGFTVLHYNGNPENFESHAATKAEALQMLLAKVRTSPGIQFGIRPARKAVTT